MNKKRILEKIRKSFNYFNTSTYQHSRCREVGTISALVEVMWEEDMISNTTYHNFQALIHKMFISA